MHTPFDNPAPETYRERISHYARDLAWGVENELWEYDLRAKKDSPHRNIVLPNEMDSVIFYLETMNYETDSEIFRRFLDKWLIGAKHPLPNQLEYWNYITYTDRGSSGGSSSYIFDYFQTEATFIFHG